MKIIIVSWSDQIIRPKPVALYVYSVAQWITSRATISHREVRVYRIFLFFF